MEHVAASEAEAALNRGQRSASHTGGREGAGRAGEELRSRTDRLLGSFAFNLQRRITWVSPRCLLFSLTIFSDNVIQLDTNPLKRPESTA